MKRLTATLGSIRKDCNGDLTKWCGVGALACAMLVAAPAYAVTGTCSAPGRFQTVGGWQVMQPATFSKGTVLASINMQLPISLYNVRAGTTGSGGLASDYLISFSVDPAAGASYPNFDTSTNSVPISSSGVGGRLTLTSASSTIVGQMDNYLPLVMVPAQKDVVYWAPSRGSTVQRYNGTFTYNAKYELVLLDPVAYAASNISGTSLASQLGPQFSAVVEFYPDTSTTYTVTSCFKGVSGSNTLASLPVIPTLPRDTPTCQFSAGDLTQTVTLDPAMQSKVAAQGSARSAGSVGEKGFSITASSCAKGAVYSVYFTDALHPSSQLDYFAPDAGKTVGVRLYHSTETTPITVGPAPLGSTLPPQAPVVYGNASAPAGASYVMPFTAQYVRMPEAGSAAAGAVNAKATVTIVYP